MESMVPKRSKHDGLPKRFILSEGNMKLFGPKKIYDIYIDDLPAIEFHRTLEGSRH